MRKAMIVVLGGLMLLALAAGPASAQAYPPVAPACVLSGTVVTPGGTVTITCSVWAPNTEVVASLLPEGAVLGSVITNADGSFTAEATIPSDTAPGHHIFRLSGLNAQGETVNVDLAFTVAAPDRAGITPSPSLPRTGGDALLALGAAVGLLAMGGAALGVARRRSRAGISA